MRTQLTLLFISFMFIQLELRAGIFHVPADFSTIQSAINASVSGDTVVVSEGEYFENIRMNGKNILLTSNFYLAMDPSAIVNTIINGITPANADSASVLRITSGENENCIIQGFTITGGAGTKWLDEHGAGIFREGGGLLIQNAAPTIRYNYIMGNAVTNATGVASTGGGAMRCGDSNPVIINNIIVNNTADGYGGGLVFNYCDHAVVKNNIIAYNTGGEDYGGGGIWATGTGITQVVDVINNTIAYNTATGSGAYGGKGGGIFIFSVTVNVRNCIVWNNNQAVGNPLYPVGGLFNINYSDIPYTTTGEGNINADPVFLDTVFCFITDYISPCTDAGDPDLAMNDPGSDLMPELAAYPSAGTIRNDMGAYGGPGRWLITDCPDFTSTGTLEPEKVIPYNIFPNPAKTELHFNFETATDIAVYNMEGKLTYQKENQSNCSIDVSDWARGTYFIRAITTAEKFNTVIILE